MMMSLPTPISRRKLHNRTIVCEGFEREDGLFDIEVKLVDAKTFSYNHLIRGHIVADSPMHDMQLRLTIDSSKTVHDIAVLTSTAPYAACSFISDIFRKLIGASLVNGWRRTVNDTVGGVDSCTHMRELLMAATTVAFLTTSGQNAVLEARAASMTETPIKPHFFDKCKGWAADGDTVRRLLPALYTGSEPVIDPDDTDV